MKRGNSTAAICIWTSRLMVASASGQSVGASVAGVVSDESVARLPGVMITLTNTTNGRALTRPPSR